MTKNLFIVLHTEPVLPEKMCFDIKIDPKCKMFLVFGKVEHEPSAEIIVNLKLKKQQALLELRISSSISVQNMTHGYFVPLNLFFWSFCLNDCTTHSGTILFYFEAVLLGTILASVICFHYSCIQLEVKLYLSGVRSEVKKISPKQQNICQAAASDSKYCRVPHRGALSTLYLNLEVFSQQIKAN